MHQRTAIRLVNWALAGMVFFVPLIFVQRTMYPFIVVKTTLFQSLAEIIVFLWAGLAVVEKEYRPRFSPLTIFIVSLFAALTFLSLFFGTDINVSLWSTQGRMIGLVALIHFVLLYLALSSLRKEIKWDAVWLVGLASSALAALGALATAKGNFFQKFFLAQAGDFSRPSSTFGNPTFLAGFLLFNVFIAFFIFFRRNDWVRWYGLLVALVDVAAIFRTQTLGDIFGLSAGMLVMFIFFAARDFRPFDFKRSILRNFWLLLLLFFVLFGATFFFTRSSPAWQSVPGFSRFSNFSYLREDLQNRLLAWGSAAQAFKERPFSGWGWENFNIAFEHYYNPKLLTNSFYDTQWDKPHNTLIEYAVSGGAFGLLLYLGLWAALFYEIIKSKNDGIYKTVFLAMFVAYFVQNLVIFDTIGTYLMSFLAMAFVNTNYRDEPSRFGSDSAERKEKNHAPVAYPILWVAFFLSLVPIYFLNWKIVEAAHEEYGGPNYFLNTDYGASLKSFESAIKMQNPYQDYARINFASVVKQSSDEGVVYSPNFPELQKHLVQELEIAVSHHPNNFFFYAFLAEFKNAFSKYDPSYLKDAEELEKKALELSPTRQQVYYVKAKTQLLENDFDGAYATFEAAVGLNPDAGDPHFYFGLLAYEKGDVKKGDEELKRAEELGRIPNSPDEATALGDLAGDVGHDYAKAIKYYDRAISLSGERKKGAMTAELKKAIAYYLNGQKNETLATFEDLRPRLDFKTLPIYGQLKVIFEDVGFKP